VSADFVVHPDGTVEVPAADAAIFGRRSTRRRGRRASRWSKWPPYREHHSWATVGKIVVGIVLVTLALAGGASAVARSARGDSTVLASPTSVLPVANDTVLPPEPTGPFVMPTVMAEHVTQDGWYLSIQTKLGWTITDPAEDIRFGHWACDKLALGFTRQQIVEWWHLNRPSDPDPQTVEQHIDIAHTVYCPDLGR
jgi:Protein of unknown function (DUF732)